MVEKAKKNLIENLHTLPLDLQKDVKILISSLDGLQKVFNKTLIDISNNSALQKTENLPHEIWKDIAVYEGLYQVSNLWKS